MVQKIGIYLIIIICVTTLACTKEVDLELGSLPQKLVINSLFNPDSFVFVHVSHSADKWTKEKLWINDATVLLYNNEVLIDTLKLLEKGMYLSAKVKPIPEEHYSIVVSTNGFENVTAQDACPKKVSIVNTEFNLNSLISSEGDDRSELTIGFNDDPLQSNYYELTLSQNAFLNSKDPVILAEGILDYYPEFLVFSDTLFNGGHYSLTVDFSYQTWDTVELVVYLRSVSEAYYQYKKKLIKHLYGQSEDLWSSSNPVMMYTNVEQGYGIFAGYSQDLDTIIIEGDE